MVSLYDYLGRPAGFTLGKQVYEFARIVKAKVSIKTVPYSPYKNGTIMTYEKSFLDMFFKAKKLFENNQQNKNLYNG